MLIHGSAALSNRLRLGWLYYCIVYSIHHAVLATVLGLAMLHSMAPPRLALFALTQALHAA